MNESRTLAVTDLLTALWFDIDHNRGINAHTFFTVDATLTFDARTFHGHNDIRGVYRARAQRATRTSRHVVTNVHVEMGAGPHAELHVTSIVSLYAADGEPPLAANSPICIADVVDKIVEQNGHMLINARRWHSLFRAPDAPLAVPTR